jgi:hypothetical protein
MTHLTLPKGESGSAKVRYRTAGGLYLMCGPIAPAQGIRVLS